MARTLPTITEAEEALLLARAEFQRVFEGGAAIGHRKGSGSAIRKAALAKARRRLRAAERAVEAAEERAGS